MSFKELAGLKTKPKPAVADEEPFDTPQTHCLKCGQPIEIRRDYRKVEGLIVGGCKACDLKAALVEGVLPIWHRGSDPNILDKLRYDHEESSRFREALTSDEYDPRWTRW